MYPPWLLTEYRRNPCSSKSGAALQEMGVVFACICMYSVQHMHSVRASSVLRRYVVDVRSELRTLYRIHHTWVGSR